MKELPSQEYLKECIDYDPDTGECFWKIRPLHHFKNIKTYNSWNTRFSGKAVGFLCNGYKTIRMYYQNYPLSSIVYKIIHNIDPEFGIICMDGNNTNLKIDNLKMTTIVDFSNFGRIQKNKTNKYGFTGIRYDKKSRCFHSKISLKGKVIHLSAFIEPEDAGNQYQQALSMVRILEQSSEDFNHVKNYHQLYQKYQEVIAQASEV
jgi:hypothetical protein